MKRAGHRLAGNLGGTIEVPVVEGVLLRHWYGHGIAIDTRGARIYKALNVVVHAGFENIEGTGHIDIERSAWIVLGVKEPHCRKINHAIRTLESSVEDVKFPNIAAVREDTATRILKLCHNVRQLTSCKVVVNRDLTHIAREEFLHNVTPDEACASDYHDVLSRNVQ